MNKGEIWADAEWKRKLISAMVETCALAKARPAEGDAAQIRAIFDGLPAGVRSSMQKDLASRQRLERDAIGGPMAQVGNVTASTSPLRRP
jgi:2-dehydropantoate 2-reductase